MGLLSQAERIVIMRAVLGLVSMLIMTYITQHVFKSTSIESLLMTPAEREAASVGDAAVKALQGVMGPGGGVPLLTSHEKQLAAMVSKPDKRTTGFDTIGGLEDVKKELHMHVATPLRLPKMFYTPGGRFRPTPGVLLEGPPGVGKSQLARAIAAEAGAILLRVRCSDIENMYYGESAKFVRAAFGLARKLQPCVLLIDEVDGLLKQRSPSDQGGDFSVKTEFLQQLDDLGEARDVAVVVVATTNASHILDEAVYRRIPRTFKVGLPDAAARRSILKRLTKWRSIPRRIVERTEKYSGADLVELTRIVASIEFEHLVSRIDDTSEEEVAADSIQDRPMTKRCAVWDRAIKRVDESMQVRKPAEERRQDISADSALANLLRSFGGNNKSTTTAAV